MIKLEYKKMKTLKYTVLAMCVAILPACQDLVDDINDNPTDISVELIDANDILAGAQLANVLVQVGHASRISGAFSGQIVGYANQYLSIYNYDITTGETATTWDRAYQGSVQQVRVIREKAEAAGDVRLQGISKVIEAHTISTLASAMGDVPFSQIADGDNFPDPAFDSQSAVFADVQTLLDDAIADLSGAFSGTLLEDIYYEGDPQKWIQAAYTLKARCYMHVKDYSSAYSAAQNGVSSQANGMYFIPRGPSGVVGDKNTFYTVLAGSRAGDVGNAGSYLMDLIDPANGSSRNNAKTDETARHAYYAIDETTAGNNLGVVNEFEPMKMISYEENQLILAEAGLRTVDFATGLGHLNTFRQFLNTGAHLNSNFSGEAFAYDDYVTADFQSGGIENADNINQDRALLREIIEERYVSGFLTFMPFDDARRLRKSDSDVAVDIPLNTTTATQHPERLLYPDNELNANDNAPSSVPALTDPTEVNQ